MTVPVYFFPEYSLDISTNILCFPQREFESLSSECVTTKRESVWVLPGDKDARWSSHSFPSSSLIHDYQMSCNNRPSQINQPIYYDPKIVKFTIVSAKILYIMITMIYHESGADQSTFYRIQWMLHSDCYDFTNPQFLSIYIGSELQDILEFKENSNVYIMIYIVHMVNNHQWNLFFLITQNMKHSSNNSNDYSLGNPFPCPKQYKLYPLINT